LASAPSDASKALAEIILVTIPAVILYFVGWVYLNAYLSAFGINVSELDLDIQTIFIYAFPPTRILLQSFWPYILLALLITIIFIYLVASNLSKPLLRSLKQFWNHFTTGSVGFRIFCIYIVTLFVAVAALPAIRWAAFHAAQQKWKTESFHVEALLKESEKTIQQQWVDNYNKCTERHALDLIMSDKESYYLLCTSSLDRSSGIVYEVRREVGLVSIRYVNQAKSQ
jgi:hypothetical protein